MAYIRTFLFFILALFSSVPCVAAEKVIIATNAYEPLVTLEGNASGLFTDIVQAVFEEMGVEVEFRILPWEECARQVEEGKVFAAMPYIITEERQQYAIFSDVLWAGRGAFFYLHEHLGDYSFTGLDSLKGLKVGVTEGHAGLEAMDDPRVTLDWGATELLGVKRLLDKEVDFFYETELVGWALVAKEFPGEVFRIRSARTPWVAYTFHLMVSKKAPQAESMVRRFNAKLERFRQNGTYHLLVSPYLKAFPGQN